MRLKCRACPLTKSYKIDSSRNVYWSGLYVRRVDLAMSWHLRSLNHLTWARRCVRCLISLTVFVSCKRILIFCITVPRVSMINILHDNATSLCHQLADNLRLTMPTMNNSYYATVCSIPRLYSKSKLYVCPFSYCISLIDSKRPTSGDVTTVGRTV